MAWSAEQQQWLSALGYTVYEQGQALPVALAEAPKLTSTAKIVNAARPRRAAPSAAEPGIVPNTLARPASRLPDKLHLALIRASGCNPNAEGARSVMAQWPDTAELRGNPAAKRALWPNLRTLRKPRVP